MNGRLTSVSDGTGTTQFGYDHRGNMTQRSQSVGATPSASLTYAYDLADRITEIGYPSGRQVRYNRDIKGRVSGIETRSSSAGAWVGLASNMSYQPFGAIESMVLGNGTSSASERGLDGRLKRRRLTSVTTGTALSDLSYVHDPDGNVGSIDDHVAPARSAIYGYDAMGRMNMMVADPGSGSGAGGSASIASYTTTTGTNQLASITTPVGTRSIAYDARGNPTAETRPGSVGVTIAYDGHGRMTSYARTGEADLTHVYNGLDDRISTTSITGSNSETRRFVYAPDGRVLGEYGTSAADVKAEFIWTSPEVGDAGTFGGDDALGGYMSLSVAVPTVTEPDRLLWVHGNHMGVPTVITDASGTEHSFPTGYALPGFPGQSRTLSDLYYNRYRDYDPTTGRYIQADPIGLAGGASPYSYAMNNPLRYTNPTGEVPWGLVFAAGDLGYQLYKNGGRLDCVDWTEVGLSAIGGGLFRGLRAGAFRFKRGGSHTWDATRKWMNKKDILPKGPNDNWHHWLFERNQGIGRKVPDWVKNQPWNISPISAKSNSWLSNKPWLAWTGAPRWARDVAGGGLLTSFGQQDCGCE